jgi:lipoprotein-anchoring transpeptidase ErfK/SrfK
LQFSTPLKSLPFQAATPANFGKLLEVDLTTKRMYAYQNGQLVNTFLVSAGKPSTPTPQGEFHIWEKLTMQTMVGPGYVQPDVPWINYFDHSGDAVHGVYWRPASVFGNINTSHGCVGLAVNLAEWVYDWAPIGTTVITYS